ncbi:Protein-glutamate O-methyltransferase [Saliniradius amylolyticus]|uniref:Sensor protein FixL n=1 Tax=Saliniradius amylolyticus TaxID=2183582 RepID=A0A2S2E390_9ALTE|nr:PAS domain S-box protein [Saliniradius amylolyticus]AWL12111.1 Protein-glutamate O-methyltransferase [Saliniradius amylolyticus]
MTRQAGLRKTTGRWVVLLGAFVLVADALILMLLSDDDDLLKPYRTELTQLKQQILSITARQNDDTINPTWLREQIKTLRPQMPVVLLNSELAFIPNQPDFQSLSLPSADEIERSLKSSNFHAGMGSLKIIHPQERWLALLPVVPQPARLASEAPSYLLVPLPEEPQETLLNNEIFPAVLIINALLGYLFWLVYTKRFTPLKGAGTHYLNFSRQPDASIPPSVLAPDNAGSYKPDDAVRFVAQSEFTALLQSIPDAALIFDHNKEVIEANSAALQLLECEPSQLQGKKVESLMGIQDRQGHSLLSRPAVELLPNRGDIISFSDCQLKTGPGHTHLVSLTLSCLSRGGKGQRRAVLIISDESALEQMRYESQQQKYLLNAMYSHTPALVYLKDRRSVYLMANNAFAEFIGRSQEHIIGQRPQQLFEGAVLEQLQALEQEVLDSGLPVTREIEHLTRTPRTFLYQEFPLKDSQGNVRYTGGIASDVTAERQLENTLQALATDSSARSGDSFFNSLVKQLQRLTKADFVFIGETIKRPHQMMVIAANHKGQEHPLFCYYTDNSPCQATLQQQGYYSVDLQSEFPNNQIYHLLNLHYYQAMPLLDAEGQAIGVMTLSYESEPEDPHWLKSTLELFCSRVSAELSRERLQRHLHRLSSKLSSHIENTPLAVIEWNSEFTVLNWNHSAEKLFGYSADEAIGHPLNTLIIAPIRWAYDSAILNYVVVNRTNNKCTHTNVSQDGREVLCEWENTVILNDLGEVESVISVIKDVTAERRLLFKIQQKELEQRQMLNSMVDAIITIDNHGLITSFNHSAETLFGYSEQDILGQNVKILMPANIRRHHDHYLAEHMRTGITKLIGTSREVMGVKSDGTEFPMRLSVNKLPGSNNDGEPHFIGSCTDITQEKQKDQQLKHSMKMDALGRLTGGVAHDFNNLLGIVSGYAELLDMSLDDDALRQYAAEILKASHRGERLTSRLLKFTRKRAAEPKPININNTLEEQREMLQRSLTPTIEIDFSLTPNLPQVSVDVSEFEDALLNLCINAKHAMDGQGRLSIRTYDYQGASKSEEDVVKRQWVVMQVEDEGIGMTEEVKQRLFEPFFSTKDEEKGTGLGLSQVYGFVDRASGFIEVDSEPNKGARFSLYFPAIDANEHTQKEEDSVMNPPYYGNETLLIVDDEVALADVLTTTLKHYGYQLLSANSAEQALEVLEHQPVDLVISDVVMKHQSGFELASQVKHRFKLPVLLISGYYDESERRNNDQSYTQLIHKPFSARTLLEAIRNTLENKGA